ncbi:uncharacterized protein LOC110717910 [Chenopodium quinoa]|uniref:uncharacterized protein LOC110717910 n=1 Tax=Chenopodium quinoa TaxID=63459 RepID=UPI000B77784D|nr:uncharacterized protein LOC110717910 [Chenopodium quinoa]
MLSPGASGFGWNDDGKFVTCPQSVWDEWIKSHKNAEGLRNKPFPFYDNLGKIFGKDRAIGNEATNVDDVLDEVDEEDKGEEEQEVPQYSEEHISSTPLCNQTRPPLSTTPTTTRTKRARTEIIEVLKEFSTKVGKISDVMEAAGEHIGRLANCFKHEFDSAERRMKVTSEVMKIEGLSPTEVLLASKNTAPLTLSKLTFFFFFLAFQMTINTLIFRVS